MVNNGFMLPEQVAAERRMILSYAPPAARSGLAALLALDDTLGGIVRSTREPLIGQMRLTWWHGALSALDSAPPPAEPVLQAIAQSVVPQVAGTALAEMIEGWEELLDADPLDKPRLELFAQRRGAVLFTAAGRVLGANAGDPLTLAGRGWALADLAAHVSDASTRERATAAADDALSEAAAVRWSRAARPLGALVHLARMQSDAGGRRVGRAIWHRLTGR